MFINVQFSPIPCHLVTLRPSCTFLSTHSRTPSAYFLSSIWETKFHVVVRQEESYSPVYCNHYFGLWNKKHLKWISICIIFWRNTTYPVLYLKTKAFRCFCIAIGFSSFCMWFPSTAFHVYREISCLYLLHSLCSRFSTFSTFCSSFTHGYVTLLHFHGIFCRLLLNLLAYATALFCRGDCYTNISVSITWSLLLTGTFYLLHEKEDLTKLIHDRLPCLPMSFPNGTHNILFWHVPFHNNNKNDDNNNNNSSSSSNNNNNNDSSFSDFVVNICWMT